MEVDRILDLLPPPVLGAFLLAQLEGLSYAQIGERLGVSISSVKQYLQKAVAHCMRLSARSEQQFCVARFDRVADGPDRRGCRSNCMTASKC